MEHSVVACISRESKKREIMREQEGKKEEKATDTQRYMYTLIQKKILRSMVTSMSKVEMKRDRQTDRKGYIP